MHREKLALPRIKRMRKREWKKYGSNILCFSKNTRRGCDTECDSVSVIISIANVFRQARSIAKNSKTYAVASDNIFVHSRVESFLSH